MAAEAVDEVVRSVGSAAAVRQARSFGKQCVCTPHSQRRRPRDRRPVPSPTMAATTAAPKPSHRKLPRPPATPTSGADRSLIHAAVPRRKWDDPDVDEFLKRGEPVVLTGGCPLVQALVDKWSFDYLAESFGTELKLNVHFAPRDTTVFARHYGKGLGTGGCTPMSFPDFVRKARSDHLERDASSAPPPLRYYLQSLMVWSDAPKDVHGELIKILKPLRQ